MFSGSPTLPVPLAPGNMYTCHFHIFHVILGLNCAYACLGEVGPKTADACCAVCKADKD